MWAHAAAGTFPTTAIPNTAADGSHPVTLGTSVAAWWVWFSPQSVHTPSLFFLQVF